MLTFLLILVIVAQAVVIRYLSIDPGFGIKTRAAGELSLWLSYPLRRASLVYGDIDSLGKINDALTDKAQGVMGHDRFNEFMQAVMRQTRRTDQALVYGGDELRWLVPTGDARGFCIGLQERMQAFPFSEAERARLQQATGKPYVSITLGYAANVPYLRRHAALAAVKVLVSKAKPKCAAGRRGEILTV